ncbi:hypothetical protein [Lysinibacillus odysseyi]|uniref:Uncharacterized protein n=1 Tax=Lysinibacillus odysseyi 34hs-1 = NBRC 100172 TaxID=1220589 RepID=A0A0A3IBZ5_9BACI|nr:hypothetical protein [Lysinibacillus odysseyi]KGR82244.1 hypothetical protein CD32_23495 [Lysinibacillus odysseyi 34hs-1 = NBRC 100172]
MDIDQDILNRIKQINWFTNCGQALENDMRFSYTRVYNWKEAMRSYQDPNWEHATLEARNELTAFLHNKYRNEYAQWNKIAKEVRAFIEKEVIQEVENYREKNELDQAFIDCVKWDIANAILESAYSKCNKRPTFFLELLKVYEAGNFPCGWDGKWPQGNVIVY